MPSEEYSKKATQVIFPTIKERSIWLADAQTSGLPLSRYILEMARRGRVGESSRPHNQSGEVAQLREENARLRGDLGDLRKLYEKSENEAFKLRHASYLSPDGRKEPSEKLLDALQASIRPLNNLELLRILGIDANDIETMKILLGQLQALRDFGLVQETPLGWKWIG